MGEADLTGRVLDSRYRIEDKLASGGMAQVYVAWDERVGRRVVVKVPHAHLLTEPTFRERFSREIASLVGFKHASIVGVLDIGEVDGVPFLVMEQLDGGTLEDSLSRTDGLQSPEALAGWLDSVAEALDYVHEEGHLHRDVKPGNILFNAHGHAFLADFGLAKAFEDTEGGLTKSGMYPGSPAYMPPDVLTGDIGPSYDQYSLAAVVLHVLTGEAPPPLRAHLAAAEALTGCAPEPAIDAVRRALSIQTDERFPSCLAFAEAFAAGVRGEAAPAAPKTDRPRREIPEAELEQEARRLRDRWAEELARLADRQPEVSGLVLIGEPGSGKSAFLEASGLSPLSTDRASVSSGFWSGRSAVVFETRCDEPHSGWSTFLTATDGLGRRRAIRGAIVIVGADALLERDADSTRNAARAVRERLGDLAARSEGKLPVYVLVSRCDLVPGFADFFGTLVVEEEKPILGWPDGPVPDRFSALCGRLSGLRGHLAARDGASLAAQLFPAEFAAFGAPLAEFAETLQAADGIERRGVYFVGGSNSGTPFFVRGLISDRILEDATGGAPPRPRRGNRRKLAVLALFAVTALLAVLVLRSYRINSERLRSVKLSVPSGASPAEAALAFENLREELPPPSFFDLGLSRSVGLAAAITAQRDRLVRKGVLAPILSEVESRIREGFVESEDGLDVLGYLQLRRSVIALREGTAADHGRLLFELLSARGVAGRATEADLVRLLSDPATGTALVRQSEQRIDREFVKVVKSLLGPLEQDLDRMAAKMGQERAAVEQSSRRLKDACEEARSELARHRDAATVLQLAEEIRKQAGDPLVTAGSAGSPTILGHLQGVAGRDELRNWLDAVRDVAPSGTIGPDLDRLTAMLAADDPTEATRRLYQGIHAVLAYLDAVQEEVPPLSYPEQPDPESLAATRRRIAERVSESAAGARARLLPQVDRIEGAAVGDEEGWWDALFLLRGCRELDALLERHIEAGVRPYVESVQVGENRPEALAATWLPDVLLPVLDAEAALLADERLAETLRAKGEALLADGLESYLDRVGEYWGRRFSDALPRAAPEDLKAAYDQLTIFKDRRGPLRRTAAEINEALYDVTAVSGPVPGATNLFAEFAVFFDTKEDARLKTWFRLKDAEEAVEPILKLLESVVGGFGGADRAAAREVYLKMIREGKNSALARGHKAALALRSQKSESEPSAELGDTLERAVAVVEDFLAELTAEEVGDQWRQNRKAWSRTIASGVPADAERIFGANGEFEAFVEDSLRGLLGPEFAPIPGGRLEAVPEFRVIAKRIRRYRETSPREDRVGVGLGLGGAARPTSLVVRMKTASGELVSQEFTNSKDVAFDFTWSPATLVSFGFEVGFGSGGESRMLEWTGRWAVAEAFAAARREGNRYIWAKNDEELGVYEVRLTVSGELRLVEEYMKSGGRPGAAALAEALPSEVLRVRR